MTDRHVFVLAILLAATPAAASESFDRPVTVSPGRPSRMVQVDDRCPTFSWGQVAAATSYQLVVYRVGQEEEEPPVALRATIAGGAGSWTPTLGHCLASGGRYAWSLRARWQTGHSDWSAPALFQVAPGPTPAQLDAALAVVRDHLRATETIKPLTGDAETSPTAPSEAANAEAPAALGDGDRPAARRGSTSTAFTVDGGIEAISFAGDGSALANVAATTLSCVGCVSGGHLQDATVTAAKIGAACASGQVLMKAPAGWQCATLTAPACTPGDEVGCYTGPAGTRGVGECLGGARVCAADATWGLCSGEILPAAAELCDGLDNTCDGPIDEGDPATLCPATANVTATLCDTATCTITGCAVLWADADGDYANGCESPAPGACLDGGVPRATVAPTDGQLVIQEFLADPASPLTDADAEWFEVAVKASVDLNGLGIGTTFGTTIDQIDVADCLRVEDGDLLLFARSSDPALNGGLTVDQLFSFSLVNGGGELHLAHAGNLVDAVSWSAGHVSAGEARNLPPGSQDATSNDDQANWCDVGTDPVLLYSTGNHGTPGLGNIACP